MSGLARALLGIVGPNEVRGNWSVLEYDTGARAAALDVPVVNLRTDNINRLGEKFRCGKISKYRN